MHCAQRWRASRLDSALGNNLRKQRAERCGKLGLCVHHVVTEAHSLINLHRGSKEKGQEELEDARHHLHVGSTCEAEGMPRKAVLTKPAYGCCRATRQVNHDNRKICVRNLWYRFLVGGTGPWGKSKKKKAISTY